MSLVQFRPEAPDAGVAHLVERHLAKVEVASSSLVTRSKTNKERNAFLISYSVPWPSGKARVCKTLTPQFKSGRHLQKNRCSVGTAVFSACRDAANDRFPSLPRSSFGDAVSFRFRLPRRALKMTNAQ